MKEREIPKETINRLPLYLRSLENLIEGGEDNITSERISDMLNLNPALIRKDLSRFGDFGAHGVGYDTKKLAATLRSILKMDRRWDIALAGVGDIGFGVLSYEGFDEHVFNVTMAFDQDPKLIGRVINGVKIEHVSELSNRVREEDIRLGIIAVPASAAQKVAERMVEGGITGLLNFAPAQIDLPEVIRLSQVNITKELEKVVYYM